MGRRPFKVSGRRRVAVLCAATAHALPRPQCDRYCKHRPYIRSRYCRGVPDPKIRIYDIGNRRAAVEEFPCVVHLVCDEREQVRAAGAGRDAALGPFPHALSPPPPPAPRSPPRRLRLHALPQTRR